MRILKFKSQLTITFFAAVNHLNGSLRKQSFTFTSSKRSWFVICDWRIWIPFVCFCVSRFVACDRNCDWRQRKTQLWRRLLNFTVRMFVKSAVTFFLFFYLLVEILHWCACCAVSLCVNCAIQKCQTKYWFSSRQEKTRHLLS